MRKSILLRAPTEQATVTGTLWEAPWVRIFGAMHSIQFLTTSKPGTASLLSLVQEGTDFEFKLTDIPDHTMPGTGTTYSYF